MAERTCTTCTTCTSCAADGRCTGGHQGRGCERSRDASREALRGLPCRLVALLAAPLGLLQACLTFSRFFKHFRRCGYTRRRAATRAWAKTWEPDIFINTTKEKR